MARADMFMSDLLSIIIRNSLLYIKHQSVGVTALWSLVAPGAGFEAARGATGVCWVVTMTTLITNEYNVIDTQALSVWWGFRHWRHWRFSIMKISSAASGASFASRVFFVCIYHWYFTMSNIFTINITLSSEFWIYIFMSVWRICRRLWHCGLSLWQPARRRRLSHRYYDDVIPNV